MALEMMSNLRHPKEKAYGGAMLVVGIGVWAIVGLFLIGTLFHSFASFFVLLIYIGFFALGAFIAAALYRAHIYGHYTMLSPSQLPQLHKMVVDGAANIGLGSTPTTFIYNSNGVFNAFARSLFSSRFLFLTSALVDADSDDQVKFVIGHELGHHAAGHLDWSRNFLKLPARFIPFLGPAYSRGRELTCDRIGAYLCNDMQASRSALQMLACGCRRFNTQLNCDAFEAQEELVPPFWGWVSLIFALYPRTTQRVIAVRNFFSESIAQSNPFPARPREQALPDSTIVWKPAKG